MRGVECKSIEESGVELALSVLSCPVLSCGVLDVGHGSGSCVAVDGICTDRSPSGVHECRQAIKQASKQDLTERAE